VLKMREAMCGYRMQRTLPMRFVSFHGKREYLNGKKKPPEGGLC
jgi:hypothetical protein